MPIIPHWQQTKTSASFYTKMRGELKLEHHNMDGFSPSDSVWDPDRFPLMLMCLTGKTEQENDEKKKRKHEVSSGLEWGWTCVSKVGNEAINLYSHSESRNNDWNKKQTSSFLINFNLEQYIKVHKALHTIMRTVNGRNSCDNKSKSEPP